MRAPFVEAAEAARRLREGEAVVLDVREDFELARARVAGVLHIPMREIPVRLEEIPKGKPVLVLCHHGARSSMVAKWLRESGWDAFNVAGGIDAWADEVDASVGKY